MSTKTLTCNYKCSHGTGRLNLHEEPYTFSDGCGCLSVAAARQITAKIGLDVQNPPSCYQVRYASYKGVLDVNPMLDRNKEFFDAQVCQKLAIAIPLELGRMMFGVIDETGILQKVEEESIKKKYFLTGPVLVTKNPSIVGCDVRMLVDVVALHHLVDVLVFPRHTFFRTNDDRFRHEYTLIWDEELALEGNQTPATGISRPREIQRQLPICRQMSISNRWPGSFFVKYLNKTI
uniref:RNA-dependent RNA polymerase n=1 Tax=Globodera pallida TaxID=36090 RepID=A0A183CQR8_GLOPA